MMDLYKIQAPTQYNAQRQPPINYENKYGHQTTNEQRRRSNTQRANTYQIAALIQGESNTVQVNGITNEESKRFGLTRETAGNRN